MSLQRCIRILGRTRMTTLPHVITKRVLLVGSARSVHAVRVSLVVSAVRVRSVSLAVIVVRVLSASLAVIVQSGATVAHAVREIVARVVEDVVRKRRSALRFRISRPCRHHPHRPCRKVHILRLSRCSA